MQRDHSTQGEARPAVQFNPLAPGYDVDPYPVYENLRDKAPVFYWEEGRSWILTRYDDIVAVLRDDRRFTSDSGAWEFASTSDRANISPELEEIMKHGLTSLSTRDHARVRKLVSPAFTPRAIERLRPEIQRIVEDVLDAARGKDVLDVARDYAELIPIRVISAMLKIPGERHAVFHRFADAVIRGLFPVLMLPEDRERLFADVAEGVALVGEVIEARRRDPLEGDMLTALIHAEEQGDKLTHKELLSLVAGLIVGGSETTIHLIAFTVLNVLRRPQVFARLRTEPELIKDVIEEVLRVDNFGKMGIMRYATEDVELCGVPIRKGQMLMLMLGSALRDGAAFTEPEMFDLRRDVGANIAFGNGAHYCLGVNLARLEGQIAVGTLLGRFPGMQLLEPPVFGPHPVIRRIESLKVSLRPSEE